jgi:hypothetical protein
MWTPTAHCTATFIATHSFQSGLSRDGEKAQVKTGVEKFYTFALIACRKRTHYYILLF